MPPVEIVTGALPELEDALAEAVADARRRDPLGPVTVLVGHVLQRPYLARALAALGVPQLNVRYVRPHELAALLAQAAPPLRLRPKLTADAERLLAHEVAGQARRPFAPIAGRDGFADALLRLFRELDLGGFTPAGFARAVDEVAGRTDVDATKLRELARLFGRYVDRRHPLAAPADHFAAADASSFQGPLLVYGAWRPAELAMRLVERIADVAPVTVFLPVSDTDADEPHASLRARLEAAGATARRLQPRDGAVTTRLARALLGERQAAVETEGAVSLVSAPDTVREVWEAARACLRWAEQGIAFHEMAVVYRNRDPYRALVDEIFAEAQIPAYIHDGRLLAGHPLGRRLLALLDLAADPAFSRAKVMEFLTETRLPRETRAPYERVRPSEWETYTREAGVVEGIEQWRSRLERLAGEMRQRAAADEERAWEAEAAQRVDALARFAREFHDALAAHPDEATWEEHLAYLRALAARYADGTAPIIDALDDLRALGDVLARPAFDVFCRAVRDDLASRDASPVLGEPVRMFGRQGVAVLDVTSLRHLRFRAVRMLGAAERSWPPPARPDPLLLEHERRAINEAGDARLPLRTEPDDEPLTFWLGVQAARERLVVSYARAEAGGSGKHLPSYFFRALAETIEGRRIEHDRLDFAPCVRRFAAGRLASDAPGEALSCAEYDRGLVRATHAGGEPAGVAALALLTPAFARAIVARRERWSRALTPYDGVMTADDAVALAAERAGSADGAAVSASRLEIYAACPYRFFLRYRLRLQPAAEPEAIERLDPLERGSLVHAILERFLREVGRDDPPRASRRDDHLARLRAIAREEGEERERRGVTGRPLIWAMDRRQIEEDLARWYDIEMQEAARTGLLPGAFEAAFGPLAGASGGGNLTVSREAPLLLRAGGRDLAFQGRIDRIDWDETRTRFRVIDYKTGRAKDKAPFDHGRALQLPIYLRAAAELLAMSPEQGEAQYFYATSRGNFRRRGVTGEELRGRAADFEQVLGTIADGIAAGMFAPNPGTAKANCMWCDYQDVCDARIDAIAQRKADDQRAAAYRKLEEVE